METGGKREQSINGTLVPLGYTKRLKTAREQLEQPLYGLKQIAPAMGLSIDRLKQYTAASSMNWLICNSETGRYSTITGSAWNFRDVIRPAIHQAAAHERGIAGSGAVERGADGKFVPRD